MQYTILYTILYTIQINKVELGSTNTVSQFLRTVEHYRALCVILWFTSNNVAFRARFCC